MWIIITIYTVVSLIGLCALAANTDNPPTSWKQWLVALIIGGPWTCVVALLFYIDDNRGRFSRKFNDWWNSLE